MDKKHDSPRLITTYGLTEEQFSYVKEHSTDEYEIRDFSENDVTDLIADYSCILIVNGDMLSDEGQTTFLNFYEELDGQFDETVVWLGKKVLPSVLKKVFKCYDSFDDMRDDLKYILLEARKKKNKSVEFCKVLTYGIMILSLIRNKPGITTAEIVEKTDLQKRTVQRYINSLQVAGEHIEYDHKIKGWKLSYGKSVLFGDYFDEK